LKLQIPAPFMWQDNSQLGQPATLLGYPVYTCDAMPSLAVNQYSVLFGNFRRGYLLVDRVGMRVLPNPYSVPGKVSFYCSRRIGGCVLNNDALKALKISLM
jgi:HK97 family phage major capsid protein